MENATKIINCVEFKNELHRELYKKSGAKNFNDYIKYINATYSENKNPIPLPGELNGRRL